MATEPPSPRATDFHLERYRFILQQQHTTNENVYRFLGLYQAIVSAIIGAVLALLVGYSNWGIDPHLAKVGVIGLMCLVTIVAAFTILLIIIGVFTWLDYRREECELTDEAVQPGFRQPPRHRNFIRWYETYIVGFVVISTIVMWVIVTAFIVPAIS